MVVSSLAAKFSPNSAFCHLAGGAMPRGGFSLDGNLHLHSWEIIGQDTALEEVFEELCTW